MFASVAAPARQDATGLQPRIRGETQERVCFSPGARSAARLHITPTPPPRTAEAAPVNEPARRRKPAPKKRVTLVLDTSVRTANKHGNDFYTRVAVLRLVNGWSYARISRLTGANRGTIASVVQAWKQQFFLVEPEGWNPLRPPTAEETELQKAA